MVDKNVSTPLYVQIANELKRDILSNRYGTHGCMETQSQLAERFSVSLITIRKAMEMLEEEELVEIRRGKGTYVRRAPIVDPLQELTGISNIMSSLNIGNEVLVPVFELQETPEWLDEKSKEQLGDKVLFIRRVVAVNGVMVACADMYLPGKYYGSILKEEVEKETVYRIYQDKLGIVLGHGRQIIRAAGATKELAGILNIPVNAPVLQIERRAYDNQGGLIEYMILTYEASKYCFDVELELSKQ